MNSKDKMIGELYSELYDNAHASADTKRKVINMAENNNKSRISFKTMITAASAVAAAAIIITAGGAIASASKGHQSEYDTIFFNGEERSAEYTHFDDSNTYMWCFTKDNMDYLVTVNGTFDSDSQTIYVEERDGYVIASDDPNPTLNLYEAVTRPESCAEIKPVGAEEGLWIYPTSDHTNEDKVQKTNFISLDKADGTADGVIWPIYGSADEYYGEAMTILSSGAVCDACKYAHVEEEDEDEMFFTTPEEDEALENLVTE